MGKSAATHDFELLLVLSTWSPRHIASSLVTRVAQPLPQRALERGARTPSPDIDEANHRHAGLLRARPARPGSHGRAAKTGDEFPPSHSIT
jgi:hypothetical protein